MRKRFTSWMKSYAYMDNDDQGLFPIAEARPEDKRETGRVVQSSPLDLTSQDPVLCPKIFVPQQGS